MILVPSNKVDKNKIFFYPPWAVFTEIQRGPFYYS